MVKPVHARRLPIQSTVSLNEDDLSSGDEPTLHLPAREPTEVGRTRMEKDEYNKRLQARGEEADLQSSVSPGAEELSKRLLNPMTESASGGGGDANAELHSPSTSEEATHILRNRHQPSEKMEENPTVFSPGIHVPYSCTVPHEGTHDSRSNGNVQQWKNDGCSCPLDPGHNHFVNDYSFPQGVTPQTAALGRDLYLRFLHEEIRVSNIRGPPCLNPWEGATLDRRYYESLNTNTRVRQSLRQVADTFAMSEQRGRVREKAACVDIESLDFNSFQDLLFGLFQEGGVTSERVVVLFFFCADLIIRSLQEQLASSFHHLLDWSQLYIVDTFGIWVEQHGGWAAVLDQSANHLYMAAKIGLVLASIIALGIYIRNAR